MSNTAEKNLMKPGKWFADFDEEGNATETCYDASFRELLGYTAEEFNDDQDSWMNRVHPDDQERVDAYFADIMARHPEGKDYDIEYRILTKWGYHWFHDYARISRRENGSVLHFEGVSFDIQHIKDFELQRAHGDLKKEVLDYILSHDEDPIELLSHFAEKIRVLFDCDQVIYRDLEATRFMVNSPAIEKTWSVPESFCRQCLHFDAHHPMYAGGYTEMDNCQEGWQGIPVYAKCPIKSSLTRIVYSGEKVAGYLAIHYVQKYHHFTDIERRTLEEFVNNLSLLVSRRESNLQLEAYRRQEEETQKQLLQENSRLIRALTENNQRVMALEDNFESLYDVELESGHYIGYVKGDFYQSNVADKLLPPGDYFEDLRGNIDAVIYPEDRDDLFNVLDREAIRKALSETDRIEHYYRMFVGETPLWFKIRVVYKDKEKKNVIIGCFNASEELEARQIEEQRAQIEENQKRLQENMAMISGLANEYHALYYVNLDEQFFKVYSIDEKRFPEAKMLLSAGRDFEEIFHNFGMSPLVHPDDRSLFLDLSTDSVREKLAHVKKFTRRFRRRFGNEYFWTEMEFVKYEDIHERANIIAVGFAEHDDQIRSEQTLNRCYAVLSKEITPQAAIDELMALIGDYYGANRAYIFEYGRNKLFINNTYEWCKEGVEPMISRLQNVPAVEVEGWMREFERQGAFIMDTLDNEYNTPETIAILEMQGIQSLIAAPLMSGDSIVGFIGIDDPTKAKTNLGLLKNVSMVAYSEILKRKENDEEHVTLQKLTDTFLSVYFADLSRDYLHNWKIDDAYKEAYGSVISYSESMGGYVRNNIAERDRERCIEMTSPEYVLEQFRTKDSFGIQMTDIMLGYEREVVLDYVKVSDDGNQFVICSKDVTESLAQKREQQRQLEQALAAAETASVAKTNFLFNMSHDIRTPMNAITGFTTMAKKYVDNRDQVLGYLEKIDVSGQQLLMLINQVLEMARIESGKVEFNERPVNVSERFEVMTTVLAEQAAVRGLTFNHSLQDIRHCNVLADDTRLSQITLNIVGNAIKYTPEGGTIDFTIREIAPRREGRATFVFTVADTGIGMSEDYLKTIYEPFTREKSSTVSQIQGTGLGMSIVKSLVDLAGGVISVQSKLGEGTRFDITLDFIIDNEMPEEEKPILDLSTFTLEGRRALLVEDNEMNREIARFILEDKGLAIEEANDGDEAVQRIRQMVADGDCRYFDFILMDVQMPRMNGYEATAHIRALLDPLAVHIPIIALSANAFEEDKQKSRAAGMDDHIAKPIDVTILWETLAKYL